MRVLCPQLVPLCQQMELLAKRRSQRDARSQLKTLRRELYQAQPTRHDFPQLDVRVRPAAACRPAHPPAAATLLLLFLLCAPQLLI